MKACTLVRCIDSLQLYIFCVGFNFHFDATTVSSLVIYDRTANLISSFHSIDQVNGVGTTCNVQ